MAMNGGGGGALAVGSPVTTGTSGSVLYIDASGNLAQDNANLFYDATNKQLTVRSEIIKATAAAAAGYSLASWQTSTGTEYGRMIFNAGPNGAILQLLAETSGNFRPAINITSNSLGDSTANRQSFSAYGNGGTGNNASCFTWSIGVGGGIRVGNVTNPTANNYNVAFSHFDTSFATATTTKSANYSASATTDHNILVDSTSTAITITLPTAAAKAGLEYVIKDWKGQSATNNITIATTSSQTIDGAATKVLNTAYDKVKLVSDGTNWSII